MLFVFFFSSRRRHTRCGRDWSSDVCSSDLRVSMNEAWPTLPFEEWKATRDTLHAHTQVLGKIQTKLAPPEPELLHSALRLGVRGWETRLLPAPDGSGGFGIALDLRRHEAVVEHVDGRVRVVPLTPNRAVRDVLQEVLNGVQELGGVVEISPK